MPIWPVPSGTEFNGRLVFDIANYGTIDTTGVKDSTAAILAAVAAAVASPVGGIVWLGPGLLKVSSVITINSPLVSIYGAGKSSTILYPTSAITGDVIRVQMVPFVGTQAGSFKDFTIDGTNAGSNACGFHFGDVIGAYVDIIVQNFFGVGQIGANLDNNTNWTEENNINIASLLNTIGINIGLSGTGTNSFGYNRMNFRIRVGGGLYNNQVGMVIYSGIQIYNSEFIVKGNIANNGSIGINMIATGTTYGGIGPSSKLDIVLEANSPGTPSAILQCPSYCFIYGEGTLDFTNGNAISSSNSGNNVQVTGWFNVPGISNYNPSESTDSNLQSVNINGMATLGGGLNIRNWVAGIFVTESSAYTSQPYGDFIVVATSNTWPLTLGSGNGGQIIITQNQGSGTISVVPSSGTLSGVKSLPPGSSAIYQFANGNWTTLGAYGPGGVVTTPAVTSGTAFTPAAVPSTVYFQINATVAGSYTLTMGPTTGAENTIGSAVAMVVGSDDLVTLDVPANWKVVLTVSSVTISRTTVVTKF